MRNSKRRKIILSIVCCFLVLINVGMTGLYFYLSYMTKTQEASIAEVELDVEKLRLEAQNIQSSLNECNLQLQELQAEMDARNAENSAQVSNIASIKGTVAIDPGHQGSWVDMSELEPDGPGSSNMKAKASTGTQGRYTGIGEYALNLDISLMLEKELTSRGYTVVLTRRDNDTAISNAQRTELANNSGADIYVRIHANGSDDPSASGALVLVPSSSNPYVAYLANQSSSLGTAVLENYCTSTGFANLGLITSDTMTGINWSRIPVIILEMGFMTNESDDIKMADPTFRQSMVQGIADGIDAYYSNSSIVDAQMNEEFADEETW